MASAKPISAAMPRRARVNGDWLVKLPAGLTRAEAMAIGTAGFTAMLALMAIERAGPNPVIGPGAGDRSGRRRRVDGDLALRRIRAGRSSPRPGARRGRLPQVARRGRDRSTGRRSAPPASRSARSDGRRRSTASARRRSPTCSRRRATAARSRPAALRGAWTCRRRSRRSSSAASRSSDRQRPLPDAAPARGVAAARGRPRSRQARGDD